MSIATAAVAAFSMWPPIQVVVKVDDAKAK